MSEENKPEIVTHPISNYKDRPRPADGIIIHSMGEYIGGDFAADFLQGLGLSAHYLINENGTIYNCVEPMKMAYHAGISEFKDRKNLNNSFIGIELLVPGDHTYASFLEAIKDPASFTEAHYESCIWLCQKLSDEYAIPTDRIVRHSDVSGPDVRPDDPKLDPGEGFDFKRIIDTVNYRLGHEE